MHWLEISLGAETDTSEILNEMIEGVRAFGRCGVTGIYVGYVSSVSFNVIPVWFKYANIFRPITSTSDRSWSEVSGSLATAKRPYTSIGKNY